MSNNTELLKALAKVQSSAPSIDKATKNPFFKSKYADLPTIWNAIKENIASNGLFVSHTMSSTPEGDYISTKIYHVDSGEFIESVSKITLTKVTAQEYGSYITYIRRYALSAMLGLVTDEDDDGNKATQAAKPKPVEELPGPEFLLIQNTLKEANDAEDFDAAKTKARAAYARANESQKKAIVKFIGEAEKRIMVVK